MVGPRGREVEATTQEPRQLQFVADSIADVQRLLRGWGISAPRGSISILDATAEVQQLRQELGNAAPPFPQPPFVVQVSEQLSRDVERLCGRSSGGEAVSFGGTNVILIYPPRISSRYPAQERSEIIRHETGHYANWFGNGNRMEFTVQGRSYQTWMPTWLEEGLAQAVATRPSGFLPAEMLYPEETICAVLLEMLARDPAVVRQAQISGDFSTLQQSVDRNLGEGAFEILVGIRPLPEGGYVATGGQAAAFLVDALERRPEAVDEEAFNRDPRVVRALVTIEVTTRETSWESPLQRYLSIESTDRE